MKMKRAIWGAVGIGGVAAAFFAVPWIGEEWQESKTFDAIQHGGYVIYIRHTDRSAGAKETLSANSPLGAFADCDDQRNLTAEGREDADKLGLVFRMMKIPVGQVIALPLCRTRQTAQLAFGTAALDPRLYDAHYVAQLFGVPPVAGNTVLVDTEDQVRQVAGIELRPGEAAVFQPEAGGAFKFIGKLDQGDLDP
jgi:hypothetical protein